MNLTERLSEAEKSRDAALMEAAMLRHALLVAYDFVGVPDDQHIVWGPVRKILRTRRADVVSILPWPAIADLIHYPGCWDTAAYPTIQSAIDAVRDCLTCHDCYKTKPNAPAQARADAEVESTKAAPGASPEAGC